MRLHYQLHGHASKGRHTAEYRCWRHINIRCHNPNARIAAGEQLKAIAAAFGVSNGLIGHIKMGKSWRAA